MNQSGGVRVLSSICGVIRGGCEAGQAVRGPVVVPSARRIVRQVRREEARVEGGGHTCYFGRMLR